ncbi:substrate-binding domain-containing protein [Streptacidiphilus rugosus]|uniref:substrate-binding domain-containing protein n=1 Tax=Streptacidiphilus rugosus TaxID=405783 RepID=UPI000568A79F|nr:substrate-binding domain-containing protein [Streptacidiphilus rugosus]
MSLSVAVCTAVATAGCGSGSGSGGPATGTGCASAMARADQATAQAENVTTPWAGPTTGPRAMPGKTLVFVAETMTNPGVAGVAAGVRGAAQTIGWNVRVIDGQGTPTGLQAAMSEAVALRPSGIVIGGFDPRGTAQQVAQANAAGITLIGWHAVDNPGPSADPRLFDNITTRVEDVSRLSADWIIAKSGGHAGVVVFTDSSIPFAENKSQLIKKELTSCASTQVLSYENIPITDAVTRMPQEVSSLLSRFGNRWTYSVAINDLYFADGAAALRAAGKNGGGSPHNIGAGDGDPSAFQRINSKQFQAATVPEPLTEQGWQIVDEFNRSFAGRPPSGYVAPVKIITAANSGGAESWNPQGYQEAYRKIWQK